MNSEIPDLVARLGRVLHGQGRRIVVAESCTAGMVSSAIVANEEFGGVLERGFIVYSIDAKCTLLGLDRIEVESCAGVSRCVAQAMAKAALNRSQAELALAVTGFAGPQEKDEEVGLVHIAAIETDGQLRHAERHYGDRGRNLNRQFATADALRLAIELSTKAV